MFLSKKRINKKIIRNCADALKKQINDAVSVIKFTEENSNIEQYDERVRDNFTWGYIDGFISAKLDQMNLNKKEKEDMEKIALKHLFPSFGIQIMEEIKSKEDENTLFELGREYAEEDFTLWSNEKRPPKKLGEYIITRNKAIDLK